MIKIIFVLLISLFFVPTSYAQKISKTDSCAHITTSVKNYKEIGGVQLSDGKFYTIHIGDTAQVTILKVLADKKLYGCFVLGKGSISYTMGMYADPENIRGGVLFFYSFYRDIRTMNANDLQLMSKESLQKQRIQMLEIQFSIE